MKNLILSALLIMVSFSLAIGPVADKVDYDNAFGFATQLGLGIGIKL